MKVTPHTSAPIGWRIFAIEDLINDGAITSHIDGNHGELYPRSDEFIESGVPYIAATCIVDGRVDFRLAKYLSPERAATLRKGISEPGDVLFAHNATVGPVALLGDEFSKVILSTTLTYFRCDNEKLFASFLRQYFQSELFVRQYDPVMRQSTRSQVPITAQRRFFILLPPPDEQAVIANILGTWDRAIETVQALIEAKTERKRGLMQRLLHESSASFEIGHARHRLGEVVERVTRKNTKGDTNVLTISAEFGLISQTEYFNRSVAGKDLSKYYLLNRGEFAYNRSSAKGYPYGAIKRLDSYDAGVVSTLYLCFRIRDEEATCSSYLRHYFEAGMLNQGLRSVAQEGARAHGLLNVTSSDFLDLDIMLPNYDRQVEIANVLDTCDRELDLHRQQLEAIREQKRGLMQKLLTGEVRVKTD